MKKLTSVKKDKHRMKTLMLLPLYFPSQFEEGEKSDSNLDNEERVEKSAFKSKYNTSYGIKSSDKGLESILKVLRVVRKKILVIVPQFRFPIFLKTNLGYKLNLLLCKLSIDWGTQKWKSSLRGTMEHGETKERAPPQTRAADWRYV